MKIEHSKIFEYAKRFGLSWNECDGLFFKTNLLNYGSFNEFDFLELSESSFFDKYFINEIESREELIDIVIWSVKGLTDDQIRGLDDCDKGCLIICKFMVENDVRSLFVDCRC